jgi:hypothetical protein
MSALQNFINRFIGKSNPEANVPHAVADDGTADAGVVGKLSPQRADPTSGALRVTAEGLSGGTINAEAMQNAGNTTTARTLRSFNAWISGNGSRGTNGADSTAATAAATDGTTGDLRTFTEDMLKDAIKDAFTDGGEPNLVLVGPFNKQKFSTFTGRATAREAVSVGTVQGAASLYASDFGTLKVVPNRTQRDRDCWVVDTTKVAVSFLRAFEPQEIGRVGDAITRDLISEYTLEMRSPNAHALVGDLTTS